MKDRSINRRLAHYRKLKGFTQEELAELLDMKPSTYSQMERMGNIDCERLVRISEIIKVDILDLLYGEEKANEIRKNYVKMAILCGELPDITGAPKPKPNPEPPEPSLTVRDQNHISVIHNLYPEDKTRVYEFAYDLFKNKRQRRRRRNNQSKNNAEES